MLLLALPLTLLGGAFAGTPAHFHPDEVAAQSKLFRTAAEAMGPAFDGLQQQLTRSGAAVERLDAAMLLSGDRAPDPLRAWSTDVRKQLAAGYLGIQRHVDLVQDDFSSEFGGALNRALAMEAEDRAVVECGSTGLAAMMGGKKDCKGEDINAILAARMDEDAALTKFTNELAEIPWPKMEIAKKSWAPMPLTGTRQWVAAAALVKRYASGAVDRRAEALEDELDPLIERIEAGDAAAVAEGQAARDRYAQALAADGGQLWAAMVNTLEKAERKGGPAGVGVCLVPKSLGGCTGIDATVDVIETLNADRRFEKAVAPLQ